MATLLEVKNKADAKLTTMWPTLVNKQNAYYAKYGKYFQLMAGSSLTVDGADTPFTVISPYDEKHIPDIDYSWTDSVPFRFEVLDMVGKGWEGFQAIVTVNHQGTLYQRTRTNLNVDSGWYPLVTHN